MKMNLNQSGQIETNADISSNNTVEFKIGDPAVVIEILRKRLYGNPIQTLVQEYLCNGRDANREAGRESKPLKVVLPTYSDSKIKIRDFGDGISPDRIKNIFVYYGASTKRGSNKQTGGFGIGAKSAWSYTDSFTITTYIDGVAYHYAAYITESNNGELTNLGTSEAPDQENGTEIQIPVNVKDISLFVTAVVRATMFWDVKPEIISNGNDNFIPSWYKKDSPELTIKQFRIYSPENLGNHFSPLSHYNTGIVIVVDGVPYPLDSNFKSIPWVSELRGVLKENFVLAVFVGNGDCEVSASREKIADSDISKEKISEIIFNAISSINDYKKEELDSATTASEFIEQWKKVGKFIVTNKEEKFVSADGVNFSLTNFGTLSSDIVKFLNMTSWSKKRLSRIEDLKIESSPTNKLNVVDSIIAYNDCSNEGPISLRSRIKSAMSATKKRYVIVINKDLISVEGLVCDFSNDQIKDFVDKIGGVNLSTFAKIKKPRNTYPKVDKSNENEIYIEIKDESGRVLVDLSKSSSKKYVYIPKSGFVSEYKKEDFRQLASFLNGFDYILCSLCSRAEKKISGRCDFIRIDSFLSNLPENIKDFSSASNEYYTTRFLYDKMESIIKSGLVDVIEDPYVKENIKRIEQIHRAGRKYTPKIITESLRKESGVNGDESLKFVSYMASNYSVVYCIESSRVSDNVSKDLIFYMNAKFNEQKNKDVR